jgi:hypothetical protein
MFIVTFVYIINELRKIRRNKLVKKKKNFDYAGGIDTIHGGINSMSK